MVFCRSSAQAELPDDSLVHLHRPGIAHVGLYAKECREQGFPPTTFTVPMSDVDRAVLDGEEGGFVKIHVHGAPTPSWARPLSRGTRGR